MRSVVVPLLVVLSALSLAALPPAARAQDAQYWTQQYGNQARLLGGAVVGGSADLSATFYNPGRLALIADPNLLLAGNVFEFTSLRLKGAVEGNTFESSNVGAVPSLFAGTIGKPGPRDHRLAYSFLARHASSFRVDERHDLEDLFGTTPDLATVGYSLDETMTEYWTGLTWSRPLGDRFGVGVTGYVSVRNQRSRDLVLAQILIDDLAGLAIQRFDFESLSVGVLAKLGLSARLDGWHLGLTVTSPNLQVMSSGSVGYDESVIAQDLDGDGDATVQIISRFQEDVGMEYRSPASLGLGASRRFGATTVHAAAEWFAAVPGYTVLDAEPVSAADGSVTRDIDMHDSRLSVLNLALGVEQDLGEDVRGYFSLRTDRSAADGDDPDRSAISVWDIYHASAGASFRALGSEFTLGLVYAFGNETIGATRSVIPDADPGEPDPAADDLEVRFRRLTGLLGFVFGF